MRFGGMGHALRPPSPTPPNWLITNRALDPDVRLHFLSLYDRGILRPGDLEGDCLPFLQNLPKPAAAFALDELGSMETFRWDRLGGIIYSCPMWEGISINYSCPLLGGISIIAYSQSLLPQT